MNLSLGGTLRPRRGVTHTLNERGGACALSPDGWEYAFKRNATHHPGLWGTIGDITNVESVILASECREEAAACRAEANTYLHGLEERLLRGGVVDGE